MASDDANETVKPEVETKDTEEEEKNMEEEQKADEPAPEETSNEPDQTTSKEAPERDEDDDDDDDDDDPSKNASGDLEEDVTMTFPQRVSIVVCSSLSHCCCCQVVTPRQVSFPATGAFSPAVHSTCTKATERGVFRNRNVRQLSCWGTCRSTMS
jgi:hypothetical protein